MTILKTIGVPGSIPFFVIFFVAGVLQILLWPRNAKLGRAWLLALSGLYVLLALPFVANAISSRLPTPVTQMPAPHTAETLVVLDGDNSLGRIRQAVQVYTATSPKAVWVLGREWLHRSLLEAGVPPGRLRLDTDATTTREQIAQLARIVESGPGRPALIASRLQMARVVALVRVAGLEVTLISSPIDDEPPTSGLQRFVPMYIALRVSRDALYEHVALTYYAWRGWI